MTAFLKKTSAISCESKTSFLKIGLPILKQHASKKDEFDKQLVGVLLVTFLHSDSNYGRADLKVGISSIVDKMNQLIKVNDTAKNAFEYHYTYFGEAALIQQTLGFKGIFSCREDFNQAIDDVLGKDYFSNYFSLNENNQGVNLVAFFQAKVTQVKSSGYCQLL